MEKGGGHGQAEGRHGKQGERGSYTQGQQSPEGGELITNAIFSSVSDPDWIRIQRVRGSGFPICIRIREGKIIHKNRKKSANLI
jgi:hypothetical protein